ncbi:class I SAM-dependent methyltransferase [Nonomuraea aridisoli]|uniref:Methyltransferase domain-containing protein n=1 Tax=Nonomuraea aridisoli TaxID=2070368 RepID=A0A2W2F5S4_9ACTN|nr:class I SAM-dependent methyltransferase [Nonomuraea aridisoli]PZG23495.1 hypothetical protein C1J01_00810 [Nonomuraea aridisoli]
MSKAGDALHRTFFRMLSRLPGKGAQVSLGRYFDWWHRKPDPWSYTRDTYEQDRHASLLASLPPRAYARILDVGCSEGFFTDRLALAHPQAETVGVDVSAQAVRSATGRGASPARFACMDIRHQTPEGAFDLVVCTEMLYYVGDPRLLRRVSERLTGLLRPGGVLVASHPWPESRRLHRHFSADALLRPLGEHVVPHDERSYTICLYERTGSDDGSVPTTH